MSREAVKEILHALLMLGTLGLWTYVIIVAENTWGAVLIFVIAVLIAAGVQLFAWGLGLDDLRGRRGR